jgi:hypothetical protein
VSGRRSILPGAPRLFTEVCTIDAINLRLDGLYILVANRTAEYEYSAEAASA